MATTDPLAVSIMTQLEVLHSWAGMFKRIIERFESSNYKNFNVIIRSDDLATVMTNLLALTVNQNSALHATSIVSFSGLQKLDQLLNQIKIRVIESQNMLLEYTLQLNEAQQTSSPILTKAIAIAPHMVNSACLLCSDPRLEEYLDDEDYPELIV